MAKLSSLKPYYNTSDGNVVASDLPYGVIAYGASGKVVGNILPSDKLLEWWDFEGDNWVGEHAGISLTNQGSFSLAGLVNQAVDYGGGTDGLYVGGSHGLSPYSQFSIFVWINPDTLASDATVLYLGNANTNAGCAYEIRIVSGVPQFTVCNGSTAYTVTASSHGALSTDTWYGVFCYLSGADLEIGISINGGTVDTNTGPATMNTHTNFFILASAVSNVRPFDGQMDELCLFSTKLSLPTVDWLYNGGSGRTYTDL